MARLYANTEIVSDYQNVTIKKAISRMQRDLLMALHPSGERKSRIYLRKMEMLEESYRIFTEGEDLVLQTGDELGMIYGLLYLSETHLGIQPFWFWNDQELERKDFVETGELDYMPPIPRVRFRGWFINDEVLINTWKVDGEEEKTWEMALEALLRCGGNMVVPGTDQNAKKYVELASAMGLWITHHHAEPLGAEMFARVYPDLEASYKKNRSLFHKLWKDGIRNSRGKKVIWNLGFRGQGDCPFWENDPEYATDEARGALISEIIQIQYEMLQEEIEHPVCCTNLYGEIMELYQKGYIRYPEECIAIWADNGYGKMVSRRQENHNPRIPALPASTGRHGIYYHVSFYDLQAANHITMFPGEPAFVKKELETAFEKGADDFLIVNCSNVKPHAYFLHLISAIWKGSREDVKNVCGDYIKRYYKNNYDDDIFNIYQKYAACTPKYGPHEDEKAGEQFYNYITRILCSAWMAGKEEEGAEELLWAAGSGSLGEQADWFDHILEKYENSWQQLAGECLELKEKMTAKDARLFQSTIMLHVEIHRRCLLGARHICRAYGFFAEKQYQQAFLECGLAGEYFEECNRCMRETEIGKWKGFYQNDCLTDIKFTAHVIEKLMGYVRNIGEGPHFYEWQREYLYAEEDRKVVLITNFENHMTDKELYQLMKKRVRS